MWQSFSQDTEGTRRMHKREFGISSPFDLGPYKQSHLFPFRSFGLDDGASASNQGAAPRTLLNCSPPPSHSRDSKKIAAVVISHCVTASRSVRRAVRALCCFSFRKGSTLTCRVRMPFRPTAGHD
jgi:hypothetical protein